MSRFSDLVSKPARDMTRYFPRVAPPQVSPTSQQSLITLDSNENPFGPSPRAIEAMRAALRTSNFYPDDDCVELRRKLASLHAVTPEQVLVTAGSTEMLALLCHALLEPGRNAVTSERSFVIYGMAVHATGAELIQAPMRNDEFDLKAIRNAINPDTRIVFLANPNNPTGSMLDATSIDRFLAEVPGHVVIVLDEAYYDFAVHFAALRKVQYPGSLEYVRRDAGVVVLRTFSKAHGLAGLRVGYGVGPAELLAYCAPAQYIFCFFRGPGSGPCRPRRSGPHRGCCFEQRVAGSGAAGSIDSARTSCASDRGKFRLLRCGRRRRRPRVSAAQRGNQRASARDVGCSELHTRDHWNAGAEPALSDRDAQDQ